MDVGQILTLTANKFPNRSAILVENRRFSYQEFNKRVNRFAYALLNMGLKKGDEVSILLFNFNQIGKTYVAIVRAIWL